MVGGGGVACRKQGPGRVPAGPPPLCTPALYGTTTHAQHMAACLWGELRLTVLTALSPESGRELA